MREREKMRERETMREKDRDSGRTDNRLAPKGQTLSIKFILYNMSLKDSLGKFGLVDLAEISFSLLVRKTEGLQQLSSSQKVEEKSSLVFL